MKSLRSAFTEIRNAACILGLLVSVIPATAQTNDIPNRLIDYQTFLAKAGEVGRLRAERRTGRARGAGAAGTSPRSSR